MKTMIMAAAMLAALCLGPPGPAQAETGSGARPAAAELDHGGGCRKDSPPGRCCHAGSKPYHCH